MGRLLPAGTGLSAYDRLDAIVEDVAEPREMHSAVAMAAASEE
jgi:hypothetical protein